MKIWAYALSLQRTFKRIRPIARAIQANGRWGGSSSLRIKSSLLQHLYSRVTIIGLSKLDTIQGQSGNLIAVSELAQVGRAVRQQ